MYISKMCPIFAVQYATGIRNESVTERTNNIVQSWHVGQVVENWPRTYKKAFLLLREKSKLEKLSTYKYELFWHFIWICFCHFDVAKFNQNCFKDLELMNKPVHKLQVCKSVLIKFSPSKWQKQIHIKCQKFSHLQMDIFPHFNISHSRRSAFMLLCPNGP